MSKRDRKRRRADRKRRRADRKRRRADRAEARGNDRRADRLRRRADQLEHSATKFLIWDRALIEQSQYRGTAAELSALRSGIDLARTQAAAVRTYVTALLDASDQDEQDIWDQAAATHFGDDPSHQDVEKFGRRATEIVEALLTHELFIALRTNKDWHGKAAPSILNRPLSKNVRIKLDLPGHRLDVDEMADTVVHEIVHTLDIVTDHPGNGTIDKALRDPDTYAEFFAKV